jgi:hypothetical protein
MSFMGRIDSDTQYGGSDYQWNPPIDHAASAKENLRQAGQDLKKWLLPDKINEVSRMVRGEGATSAVAAGLSMGLGILAMPWAVLGDAFDLMYQPLAALKDAADAAAHGVIAGFQKVSG